MNSRHPESRIMVVFLSLLVIGMACADQTIEDFNKAFGVPFFADESLWDDTAEDVAERLDWPQESQTSGASSYRKYSGAEDRLLGCRPYSLLLTAEEGKPASLSMIFANKGDAVDYNPGGGRRAGQEIRDYKRAIQEDKKNLIAGLTQLFGEPVADRFGQGRETRESMKRWNWN